MVKSGRPVVVIAPQIKGRGELVTIVALSTVPPTSVEPFHCVLPQKSMPQLGRFQRKETWVKGDMVYTVGFHRLESILLGKTDNNGKRKYFTQRLGRDQMKAVYTCVLESLKLGHLTEYL